MYTNASTSTAQSNNANTAARKTVLVIMFALARMRREHGVGGWTGVCGKEANRREHRNILTVELGNSTAVPETPEAYEYFFIVPATNLFRASSYLSKEHTPQHTARPLSHPNPPH